MDVALAGFLTGLSLIVAIGAQNAYVLRLGLARNHVGVAVAICAGADALLIAIGVGGLGAIVQTHGDVLTAIALIGGAYLLWFAFRSFRSALHPDVLLPSQQEPQAVAAVAVAVLGLTFLNPHVYLDTILLVGTIGASFGADRWWFALGAAFASLAWFSGLGFGARLLSPLMARPVTWRVLDAAIGVVMLTIAIVLVRSAVL
ncbi:MAG: amino acid transporter [Thermoleophilia bacterium]|nr:MAG: amino acid transporter [Thermoleophilia bacterium]